MYRVVKHSGAVARRISSVGVRRTSTASHPVTHLTRSRNGTAHHAVGPAGLATLMASPFAAFNAFAEAFDKSIQQTFGRDFAPSLSKSLGDVEHHLGKAVHDTLGFGGFTADFAENTTDYVVTVEVPGVTKDSLKVDIDDRDHVITITAERKLESEEKPEEGQEVRYHRIERSYGHISRSFALPDNANLDGVQAKLENGVLRITVPKRETSPPPSRRRVDVS